MTKERILGVFEDINLMYNNPNMYDGLSKMLDELVEDSKKSVEVETCGDCVSRQAVNKLVDELARAISDEKCHIQRGRNYGRIMHDILELPSVEPERKTGKWEYIQYDGNQKIGNWHCSNCRLIVNLGFEGKPYYHYCPSCGARMEVDG